MPVIVKKTDLQRTLEAARQNHEYARTFTDPKSAAKVYATAADSCVGALLGAKLEYRSEESSGLVLQALISYTAAAQKYQDSGHNGKANKMIERGLYVLGAYGFNPVTDHQLDQVKLLLETAKSVKTMTLEIFKTDLNKALRTEHEK